ncbi:hypothetical protein FLK61_26195 [Paenalkalicoccus suaedae]|uniref:Uncharacterized protein n=1 Tax=Paenalkalicoccus suaedae TaxID=2592382 RepID=A0A859FCF9_9BACI|nr:hypothetical protein [Paenalkalicoccus suaedae]QKS70254.1 hypothetical protein FLK61_26195 [Paenalkalicoccus suaedae]
MNEKEVKDEKVEPIIPLNESPKAKPKAQSKKVEQEAIEVKAEPKNEKVIYIGPTFNGIQQFTALEKVPESFKEVNEEHAFFKYLFVKFSDFPKARQNVFKTGTREYQLVEKAKEVI